VLLAICTLSALPWMVVEFKKANYSVHYQGEPVPRRHGIPVPSCAHRTGERVARQRG
jgi:hypothetical protein